MKLNERGVKKVYDVEESRAGVVTSYYEDIEFEPDDFTDGVMLTADEARLIRAWFDRLMFTDEIGEVSVMVFDPLFSRLDKIDFPELSK